MFVRYENFRYGQWMLRGEGDVPAGTTREAAIAYGERLALSHPVRIWIDGDLALERGKLTRKEAKAILGC